MCGRNIFACLQRHTMQRPRDIHTPSKNTAFSDHHLFRSQTADSSLQWSFIRFTRTYMDLRSSTCVVFSHIGERGRWQQHKTKHDYFLIDYTEKRRMKQGEPWDGRWTLQFPVSLFLVGRWDLWFCCCQEGFASRSFHCKHRNTVLNAPTRAAFGSGF